MFETELNFFIANQPKLVASYDGRFLILRGETVEGDYATALDAYEAGIERFGAGNFMLQKCVAGPEAYSTTVHTPGIISLEDASK
jgi:hypothetical protein